MFAKHQPRRDFADTQSASADGPWAWRALGRQDGMDAELMASSDAADRHLLRMVLCVAAATLLLAVVTSLGV